MSGRLGAVEVFTAKVPMRRGFAHAAKTRAVAESVFVRCEVDDVVGWGEGAPRRYVTGESLESVVRDLSAVDYGAVSAALAGDFADGVRALADLDLAGQLGHCAAAALETALFDAWCRAFDRPVSDVFGVLVPADHRTLIHDAPQVRSSALVLDLTRDPGQVLDAMSEQAVANLRHVKVKAGPDHKQTARDVATVGRYVDARRCTVSVDANGGWSAAEAETATGLLAGLVDWIEEPTRPRDWPAMRDIQRRGGCPVMLDESATGPDDLREAVRYGAARAVNVRVSKCGGLTGALRTVVAARELGLDYQFGVQVAELGPLWAAGRALAAWVGEPTAVESGRQDEWFAPALTEPAYRIDRERHFAAPLDGPGIGLVPGSPLTDILRLVARPRMEILL